MTESVRAFTCSSAAVFDVIADARLWPAWVVGVARVRGVQGAWPSVGARVQHSSGVWPLLLDDATELLEWDPPHRAVLRPVTPIFGGAIAIIEAQARPGGCTVRLREQQLPGFGRWIPRAALDLALGPRNRELLRRLSALAEPAHPSTSSSR